MRVGLSWFFYINPFCGVLEFHLSEQHAIFVSHGEMLINAPPGVDWMADDKYSMWYAEKSRVD